MKRAEVWWADLPKPVGRRPVVLLSRDATYQVRTSATVAVVTKTIRDIPVEVELRREDGLPEQCVVNLDNILTIPLSLLGHRIATLTEEKMKRVEDAIRFALDLRAE